MLKVMNSVLKQALQMVADRIPACGVKPAYNPNRQFDATLLMMLQKAGFLSWASGFSFTGNLLHLLKVPKITY